LELGRAGRARVGVGAKRGGLALAERAEEIRRQVVFVKLMF
jgi:hypothetical protein